MKDGSREKETMLSSVESSSSFVSSNGNSRRRSSSWCIRRTFSMFFFSVAVLFVSLTTPSWLSNGKVTTTTTTTTTATAFEPRPAVISIATRRHGPFSSSTARFQQSPSSSTQLQPQHVALRSALQTVQYLMDSGSMEDRKRGSMVEQRESTIPGAGFGLFATRSIQAGTIVSYYPVHRIGVEYDTDTNDDDAHHDDHDQADVYATISVSLDDSTNEFGISYNHESGARPSDYLHFLLGKRPLAHRGGSDSTKELFSGGSLFIDSNPERPLVPGWMSHLVNDGATVQANTEQGVLNYYAASRQVKNCVHVPFGPSPILATVTTRKVKKGQELFTTYGCSYWLDALLLTDPYLPQNDDDDVVDCTDITDAIQAQVTETARDILMTMQGVAVRRQQEASGLHGTYQAAMLRVDP